MSSVFFNFYEVSVLVESESDELLKLLEKDFSSYQHSFSEGLPFLRINCSFCDIPWEVIPKLNSLRQSHNSITYEDGEIRYNDYYGKLLSIFNYEKEEGSLYSKDLNKLHEITYLLILSRVGKKLDLLGLHKIHAFGILYPRASDQVAVLGMMPSRGGKSTLFSDFIKDPLVGILSDDTPIITRGGDVLPFSIRIGLSDKGEGDLKVEDPEINLYSLEREFYGKKNLLSIKGLNNPTSGDYNKIILMEGIRSRKTGAVIIKTSKVEAFYALFINLVLGLGLPMILEYFWETGSRDFLRKSRIFLSRLLASFNLIRKADHYKIYLGPDTKRNSIDLKNFLDSYK